jgi:hypothetical protein
MTSFCRRVIAMRMIVANKKRIASVLAGAHFWSLSVRQAVECLVQAGREEGAVWSFPILKFSTQKIAMRSCQYESDAPR